MNKKLTFDQYQKIVKRGEINVIYIFEVYTINNDSKYIQIKADTLEIAEHVLEIMHSDNNASYELYDVKSEEEN